MYSTAVQHLTCDASAVSEPAAIILSSSSTVALLLATLLLKLWIIL
jgi:hypothetical protein